MLLKLYKKQDDALYYWETWSRTPVSGTIHWGIVGERGSTTKMSATSKANFQRLIQEEIAKKRAAGFAEPVTEAILVIEYEAKIMTTARLKKLHRLEERLDQLMGRTGLGHADGSGYGFEKMDVSVIVVDFEIAKKVIMADLEDTEFGKYLSISQLEIDEDETSTTRDSTAA